MTGTVHSHPCQVAIDPTGIENLGIYLDKWRDVHSSIVVMTDANVVTKYGEKIAKQLTHLKIPAHWLIMPTGESSKNLETATHCWEQMQTLGIDRRALVISLGGGVVSDLAGFVASCYMRGIDIMHMPTTIMGMVDAAIGGKTGVNLPRGKNMVGTIHHPKLILIDPAFLSSLDAREIRAGMAEVIKSAVIWDPDLFVYLDQNMEQILKLQQEKVTTVISQACMIKAAIVKEDERDLGVRSILNYGHTFAHALETMTDYKTYLHGEAVAIGMSCAGYLSNKLGYVSDEFVVRQDALLKKAGLSTRLPDDLNIERLINLMAGDKKAEAGQISCIVSQGIGKAIKVPKVDRKKIEDAIKAKQHNETRIVHLIGRS